MKNSKSVRGIIGAIIIVMLLSGLAGCNKTNVQVDEENKTQNEVVDNTNKNEENLRIKRTLQEISGDYTLEEAELDNAFIVGKDNLPQNKEALNLFTDNMGANKNDTLRVVMETSDSLLTIMDIEISGDNFVVTQNNKQMSGDITENIYSRNEYSFTDSVINLEDGLSLQLYSLTKENFEEAIELFAYVLENIDVSGNIENEIIESGEDEKVIEISE